MGSGGLPSLPGLHDPLEDDGKQSEEQFLHGVCPLVGWGDWLDSKHTFYLFGNGLREFGQSLRPFAANH